MKAATETTLINICYQSIVTATAYFLIANATVYATLYQRPLMQ